MTIWGRASSELSTPSVTRPATSMMRTRLRSSATDDLVLAERLLEVAASDCLCSDGGTHSLVKRTVTRNEASPALIAAVDGICEYPEYRLPEASDA